MPQKQLLEKIISEWPYWNLDISSSPAILQKFDKGLTNDSWLIESGKKLYVLRINKKSKLWKTDRINERKIQSLAHSIGLAARVIYDSPRYEYRITEYLKYKEDFKQDHLSEKEIYSLCNAVNNLNKINIELPIINYSNELLHYWKIYTQNIKPSSMEINEFQKNLEKCNAYEKNYGNNRSLCHHDLNKDNIIFCSNPKDTVKFLDWEFSGIGIQSFDFASLACEFDLDLKKIIKFTIIEVNELKAAIEVYRNICKYYMLALES